MDTSRNSRRPSRGFFQADLFRPAGLVLLLALGGCGSFAAQGLNSEGVRQYQQAQYQTAIRNFQEAIYNDPNNPNGYYNLASTYHRLGKLEHRQSDLDQSEKYYNMCLDRNGEHVECYRGLAVLLAEQGRKEEAFRLLDGWAQRNPRSADAKIELARLNDEYGNRDTAESLLIDALAADPNSARALTALGKIREESGDKVQALANYKRSLEVDNRQEYVASRVTALSGGAAGPAGALGPSVELGTRIAERSTDAAR